jgi:hypothetical protein
VGVVLACFTARGPVFHYRAQSLAAVLEPCGRDTNGQELFRSKLPLDYFVVRTPVNVLGHFLADSDPELILMEEDMGEVKPCTPTHSLSLSITHTHTHTHTHTT